MAYHNPRVEGSNPPFATKNYLEALLCKAFLLPKYRTFQTLLIKVLSHKFINKVAKTIMKKSLTYAKKNVECSPADSSLSFQLVGKDYAAGLFKRVLKMV